MKPTITVAGKTYQILGLDFETFWSTEYSLRRLTTTQYLRDLRFRCHGVAAMTPLAAPYWVTRKKLASYFDRIDWPNTAILAHHAHFDGAILRWHFGHSPGLILDTLSMGRALYKNLNKLALEELARFFKLKNKAVDVLLRSKGIRDLPPALERDIATYAGTDIELTTIIFFKMLEIFPFEELEVIDETIRMYVEPAFQLDVPKLERALELEIAEKRRLILAAGFKDLEKGMDTLQSATKFAKCLQKAGVEPPTKISERTGDETFAFSQQDEEFIELLDHPKVGHLVAARLRVKSTLSERRAERLLDLFDGSTPLPLYIGYARAHTLRWGGGDKINPQNFPRTDETNPDAGLIKQALVAPPGYQVVVGDLSQIEARLVAYVAGQQDVVAAFADPTRDPYKELASRIYNKPIAEITKAERFIGKVGRLALGFQLGPRGYQHTLAVGVMGPPVDLDLSTCQQHVRIFRKTNREIEKLWGHAESIISMMKRNLSGKFKMLEYECEKLYLPGGLYLHYPKLWNYEVGEEIVTGYQSRYGITKLFGGKFVENYIQALARLVISHAMVQLKRMGIRCYLTVHDELVLIVRTELVPEIKRILNEILTRELSWAPGLPLACEIGANQSYGLAK